MCSKCVRECVRVLFLYLTHFNTFVSAKNAFKMCLYVLFGCGPSRQDLWPSSLRTFSASTMASPDSQPRDTLEVVCETQVVEVSECPMVHKVPESGMVETVPYEDAAVEERPAWRYLTESTVICLL